MGWHVRACWLPDGGDTRDRWLSDDGWGETSLVDAEELPGAYALAGLVDAHSHVSFAADHAGPRGLDTAGAAANLARHAAEGVAVLRDAGGDPGIVLSLPRVPGHPYLVPSGRHLAPPGMYFEAVHLPVEPEELIEVALTEVAAGATWVKLVADFPSAAARASSPPGPAEPAYDLAMVERLVDAAHRHGARVLAHVTTQLAADLVRLGVDSIEHGTALDEDSVAEMGRRGTAWTPTLCAVLTAPPGAPPERLRIVAARREWYAVLLPAAIAQGVPVLTGSDVVGSIPREVALLVECGVNPTDALRAATTTATAYLGKDAAPAPPSVVTYDADPRDHPEVLAHPAAVVIGGLRVR